GQGEGRALHEHERHGGPAPEAMAPEAGGREPSDVADDPGSHANAPGISSSGALTSEVWDGRGQNQPMKPMVTGIEPQTRNHSSKIEPMNSTVIAIAVSKGQMLGPGEPSRMSGRPSEMEVSRTSRCSGLRPSIAGSSSPLVHSGWRLSTTGVRPKL